MILQVELPLFRSVAVAFVTQISSSQRVGIAPVVVLLLIGAVALFWVKDSKLEPV